jgi:hypothetical protein
VLPEEESLPNWHTPIRQAKIILYKVLATHVEVATFAQRGVRF